MRSITAIGAVIIIGALTYILWPSAEQNSETVTEAPAANTALVEVSLPDALSPTAQLGKRGFEAKCSSCHGVNAGGLSGVAPPLVHVIYEPGHHGDESFQRAAAMGVGAHHWPFGNMPAVEGITRGDVTMIVAYIRELQRANGIN